MPFWLLVVVVVGVPLAKNTVGAATTAGGGRRGYLYVSNRLDEVAVSAASLRRAWPRANTSLVADRATIDELRAREAACDDDGASLFDMVFSSEELLPGTSTSDSMGFRVQKLRALRFTPYAETVYLDSDVVACAGFDEFELWDGLGDADVGGVTARGRSVNGGVLAYRKRGAIEFLAEWERLYSRIMSHTRREQPVLQKALKSNLTRYAELDRRWNCRGSTECTSKCALIHDHQAYAAVATLPFIMRPDVDRAALRALYRKDCPRLSGGHPVVFMTSPHSVDHSRLERRLGELRKDNDAEACLIPRQAPSIADCVKHRRRYGVVAIADSNESRREQKYIPGIPSSTPVSICWLRHPTRVAFSRINEIQSLSIEESSLYAVAVRWFARKVDVDAAIESARTNFAAVLLVDRQLDSFRLLETILPSHFLRLANGAADDQEDFPASAGRNAPPTFTELGTAVLAGPLSSFLAEKEELNLAVANSFVQDLLSIDSQLYDALQHTFDERLRACQVGGEGVASPVRSRRDASSARRKRRRPPKKD